MKSAIRCRIAACREVLEGQAAWSFYLINDADAPIDALLHEVNFEWGDQGAVTHADVRIDALAPRAKALLWRDDGEFRTELALRVRLGAREAALRFEFPKLYIQRNLSPITELNTVGWQVAAGA